MSFGLFYNPGMAVLYATLFPALAILIMSRPRSVYRIFAWCALCLILGIARSALSQPDTTLPDHIGSYANSDIMVSGAILAEPDVRVKDQRLTVGSLMIDGRETKGRLLATVGLTQSFQYGNELSLSCFLERPEPFDSFAYDRYLARFGIYGVCRRASVRITGDNGGNVVVKTLLIAKEVFLDTANSMLSEPHASFLSALLIGARRGIPDDIVEAFNRTGTTHIVAISGSNITIIAALIINVINLAGTPRRYAFWLVTSGIGLFVIFTGATASVVRAGVMACVVLIARQLGRPSRATNVIVLAATLMAMVNPMILIYDAGFQLSFLATLGLVYINPLMDHLLSRAPNPFGIRDMFGTTLSAMVTTTPLILYQFGRLSLIAPIANMLVLPFIPIIMAFGFGMVLIALVFPVLGPLLAWPTWLLLESVLRIIELLAAAPFASIEFGSFHWVLLVALYAVIGCVFWWGRRTIKKTQYDAQTI